MRPGRCLRLGTGMVDGLRDSPLFSPSPSRRARSSPPGCHQWGCPWIPFPRSTDTASSSAGKRPHMSARWTRSTSVLTQHPWSAAPVAPSPSVAPPERCSRHSRPLDAHPLCPRLCVRTSAHPLTPNRHFCASPGMRMASFLPEWICFNPHNSPVSPGADTLHGWGN